jgi:hypothetical protein
MSRSRSRLAADWFAKLRVNAGTQEVEHEDVEVVDAATTTALTAKADTTYVNTAISNIDMTAKADVTYVDTAIGNIDMTAKADVTYVDTAIGNIPPSNNASALTTGTLPADRIGSGAITDAKIAGMSSSKLSGALPAIDGSALTGMASGLPSTVGQAQDEALVVNSNGTTSWEPLYSITEKFYGPISVSGSWSNTIPIGPFSVSPLTGSMTSNNIGDSQSTTQTVRFNPGTVITYRWRTSSESCCDKTRVYENGTQVYNGASGSYTTRTFTASGSNELKFTYYKDSSASSGSDNCLVQILSSNSFEERTRVTR